MLTLYDREASGNAYKVRLLLGLLGVACERIPVAMKAGRNEVDAAYLALRYDPARRWLPQDALGQGRVMQWLELAQNEIATGLFRARMIAHMGLPGDLGAAHAQAAVALQVLEGRLAQADWLAGDTPTLADVACYPYVALAHQGQVDLSPYPAVVRWVARMQALPGFVAMAAQ